MIRRKSKTWKTYFARIDASKQRLEFFSKADHDMYIDSLKLSPKLVISSIPRAASYHMGGGPFVLDVFEPGSQAMQLAFRSREDAEQWKAALCACVGQSVPRYSTPPPRHKHADSPTKKTKTLASAAATGLKPPPTSDVGAPKPAQSAAEPRKKAAAWDDELEGIEALFTHGDLTREEAEQLEVAAMAAHLQVTGQVSSFTPQRTCDFCTAKNANDATRCSHCRCKLPSMHEATTSSSSSTASQSSARLTPPGSANAEWLCVLTMPSSGFFKANVVDAWPLPKAALVVSRLRERNIVFLLGIEVQMGATHTQWTVQHSWEAVERFATDLMLSSAITVPRLTGFDPRLDGRAAMGAAMDALSDFLRVLFASVALLRPSVFFDNAHVDTFFALRANVKTGLRRLPAARA